MQDIDINIKNTSIQEIRHCGQCDRLIAEICRTGVSGIKSLEFPCLYKVDDLNKYLLRCIIECYKEDRDYIKPIILLDEKHDHHNNRYMPDSYNLTDFIISNESDIYLVNGEAGIGKSTFLGELYYETALYALTKDHVYLPIMLRMESFGSDNSSPQEWIKKTLEGKYHCLNFEPALFNPNIKVIFFLDAINDMQYLDYKDFENKLHKWRLFIDESINQYANICFVMSSRYLDLLSFFEIHNYTKLFIQPFNDDQIYKFIESKNFDRSRKDVLSKTIEKNKELPFLRIPFFLNQFLSLSLDEINNKTDIINAFLKSIFEKKNSFVVRRMIETKINSLVFNDVKLNGSTFINSLSQLAYNNQKHNKIEISRDEIKCIVHDDIELFIDLAMNNSIFDKHMLKFIHPIFQEYFAGLYVFSKLPPCYEIDDIIVFEDITRLIQSIKHMYNLLKGRQKLINLLIENNQLKLAAECVLEDNNNELRKQVADAIICYINQSKEINKIYEYGFLLGTIGDPRVLPELSQPEVLEPKVVQVDSICVGIYPVTNLEYSYFLNDVDYKKNEYWENIDSLNWLNCDARILSIYNFWSSIQDKLNDNRERFFSFCKANHFDKKMIANLTYFKAIPKEDLRSMIEDLYSEQRGEKPLMWDIPTYNNPSQPVIGVSIYEAFAYCSWLSKKTHKNYRLLTNEEWNKISEAANKTYAYGNVLNTSISNTNETGIKKVLPVGMSTRNISKYGIYDLTGNIFEWTSSVYKDAEDGMFKQYICKGGSWIQDSSRAESQYIGRGMGWARNLDLGFRVCYDAD